MILSGFYLAICSILSIHGRRKNARGAAAQGQDTPHTCHFRHDCSRLHLDSSGRSHGG